MHRRAQYGACYRQELHDEAGGGLVIEAGSRGSKASERARSQGTGRWCEPNVETGPRVASGAPQGRTPLQEGRLADGDLAALGRSLEGRRARRGLLEHQRSQPPGHAGTLIGTPATKLESTISHLRKPLGLPPANSFLILRAVPPRPQRINAYQQIPTARCSTCCSMPDRHGCHQGTPRVPLKR